MTESTAARERRRLRAHDYYITHQRERLAYATAYREANTEKIKIGMAAYRDRPDRRELARLRAARYVTEHYDEVRSKAAVRYWANPDKYRAQQSEYRNANPEADKARSAAYQKAHPDKFRVYLDRRRAKERDALCRVHVACQVGDVRALAVALRIPECWMCLAPPKPGRPHQLEHIVPIAREGAHCIDNVAWGCRSCNSWKKDRLTEELFP